MYTITVVIVSSSLTTQSCIQIRMSRTDKNVELVGVCLGLVPIAHFPISHAS